MQLSCLTRCLPAKDCQIVSFWDSLRISGAAAADPGCRGCKVACASEDFTGGWPGSGRLEAVESLLVCVTYATEFVHLYKIAAHLYWCLQHAAFILAGM